MKTKREVNQDNARNRRYYWRTKIKKEFGIELDYQYSEEELKEYYNDRKGRKKIRESLQKKLTDEVYSDPDPVNDPTLSREAKEYSKGVDEFWMSQDMYREDTSKLNLANSDSLLRGRGGSLVWVDPIEVDLVYDEENRTLWRKSVLDKKNEKEKRDNKVWKFIT